METMYRSRSNRTKLYAEAVAALKRLAKAEGFSAVTEAAAEVTSGSIRRLVSENFGRLSQGMRLIHKLKDKHGKAQGMPDQPPGDDHPELFIKNGKPTCYCSQPYGISYEDLKRIVEFCEKWDLRASIRSETSWHFPGRTLSIFYVNSK